MHAKKDGSSPRRKFLNRLWAFLGVIAFLEFAWLSSSMLRARRKTPAQDAEENFIAVGKVEDFPEDSVTAIPEGQFYLTRLADGSFLALSKTCTHLGCALPWDEQARKFVCPCHGSTFNSAGEVLTPPATRGLNSYPLFIENGTIRVNIAVSQKILRDGKSRSVKA